MKVTPVKHYSDYHYPTRSIIDEHPELLKLLPKRWQGNPMVLAALTGMCMLMAGARDVEAYSKATVPATRVAPIFDHGDGRGSFGCYAINPPVFLSEAEARTVIIEEAKRAGIDFKPDGFTLKNVDVPITNRFYSNDGDDATEKTKKQPLALDAVDAKRHIAFEYVSDKDFDAWHIKDPKAISLGETVNIKGTAEILRTGLLKAKSGETIAVFYDPCTGPFDEKIKRSDYTKMAEEARHISSEELRKQVRDFVAWLKAQGVI